MKIGFAIAAKHTWYERIPIDEARPWLKNVYKTNKRYIYKDNTVGKEIATFLYLQHTYKNHEFILITYGELVRNPDIWKKIDVLYNGFVDINTARCCGKSKGYLDAYMKVMRKHKKKLLIPLDYQLFTNKKCEYYEFLTKKKHVVAPFACVTKKSQINPAVKRMKKENTFIKPSGGYASLDVFQEKAMNSTKMRQNIEQLLNKKYPEVVVAKDIKNFSKTLEVRFFYFGTKLEYILGNDSEGNFYKLKGDTTKAPYLNNLQKYEGRTPNMQKLTKLANDTFKLFRPKMGPAPIITRLDFGCCAKEGDINTYFLNEIEYAPGLVEWMGKNQFMIDKLTGDSIVDGVKNMFLQRKRAYSI